MFMMVIKHIQAIVSFFHKSTHGTYQLSYVGCDVLQRSLNPLTPTITIPPPIPCTPEETVPNQRVFGCVMEYLKTIVEPEWKLKDNPTLKGLTRLQVQESFVHQLHHYACLQYPFDAPVEAGQSILSWWIYLTWIPEVHHTEDISVKPNDMPEEHTMSIFTRMNSALRNRQQVQTLVDMMQIRQWHMYDPKDFFDAEQVIFGKGKSTASWTHSITESSLIIKNSDEHKEILDEDTHTWLNDKIENMLGDSTFDAKEDIDLDVPELTKILADDPPQGSVSKGKKREQMVACIDDTNDANGEWVWK
ncbi:hypothetical protein EV424DRAFT_1540797 [Suillus variegatus]|nr:hypothetical protein EV424DRAFT_1540797 [Suillus variegatus]